MVEAKLAIKDINMSKSPGDANDYMYFTLPNKVQVLLINDNN